MFSEKQQRLSESGDHTGLSLIQAQSSTIHFSGALQNCEKRLLVSSRLSAFPSVRMEFGSTERIFMKFDI
jgi:hypothetical protein